MKDPNNDERMRKMYKATYHPYSPLTEMDKIEERAEKSILEIIHHAARRASVLFQKYGWTVNPDRKEDPYVPTTEHIQSNLLTNIEDMRKNSGGEFAIGYTGSGRVYVYGEYDMENTLTGIDIFLKIGYVPIQYKNEQAHREAREMRKEDK